MRGCRVVGIAGKQEKCDFCVQELGLDACVTHLVSRDELQAALEQACPNGIDIYFENVGGKVFEAVLPLLNHHARISICGMIASYGDTAAADDLFSAKDRWFQTGDAIFKARNVKAHGLFVGNFVESHQQAFLEEMAVWVAEGKVRYKEDLWLGIERTPEAFMALLGGGNFGKTLIGIGEDPTLSDDEKQRQKAAPRNQPSPKTRASL